MYILFIKKSVFFFFFFDSKFSFFLCVHFWLFHANDYERRTFARDKFKVFFIFDLFFFYEFVNNFLKTVIIKKKGNNFSNHLLIEIKKKMKKNLSVEINILFKNLHISDEILSLFANRFCLQHINAQITVYNLLSTEKKECLWHTVLAIIFGLVQRSAMSIQRDD